VVKYLENLLRGYFGGVSFFGFRLLFFGFRGLIFSVFGFKGLILRFSVSGVLVFGFRGLILRFLVSGGLIFLFRKCRKFLFVGFGYFQDPPKWDPKDPLLKIGLGTPNYPYLIGILSLSVKKRKYNFAQNMKTSVIRHIRVSDFVPLNNGPSCRFYTKCKKGAEILCRHETLKEGVHGVMYNIFGHFYNVSHVALSSFKG